MKIKTQMTVPQAMLLLLAVTSAIAKETQGNCNNRATNAPCYSTPPGKVYQMGPHHTGIAQNSDGPAASMRINVAMSLYNNDYGNFGNSIKQPNSKSDLDLAYSNFKQAMDNEGHEAFGDKELLTFNKLAYDLKKPINHAAANARIRDLLNAEQVSNGQQSTHTGRKMQKPN